MIVYGRNAVTEALRGKRRVRRIWAVKGDWSGAPVTQASPADITARCGSDAHQGVCADVEDYRYADAAALLAPNPSRSSSPSTRSQTRRTSARSAGRRRSRARPA